MPSTYFFTHCVWSTKLRLVNRTHTSWTPLLYPQCNSRLSHFKYVTSSKNTNKNASSLGNSTNCNRSKAISFLLSRSFSHAKGWTFVWSVAPVRKWPAHWTLRHWLQWSTYFYQESWPLVSSPPPGSSSHRCVSVGLRRATTKTW